MILTEKLNFLLSPFLPNGQFNHAFSFQIIFQKTTKIVFVSLFVPAWSLRVLARSHVDPTVSRDVTEKPPERSLSPIAPVDDGARENALGPVPVLGVA